MTIAFDEYLQLRNSNALWDLAEMEFLYSSVWDLPILALVYSRVATEWETDMLVNPSKQVRHTGFSVHLNLIVSYKIAFSFGLEAIVFFSTPKFNA